MGGGDLNMKKHFHPQTRENLERVWLAEQKHAEELKRIEERRKEIAEERSKQDLIDHASEHGIMKRKEERLEWMYSSKPKDTEEYLLGKEIDSEIVQSQTPQDKNSSFKAPMRFRPNPIPANVVDMTRKLKEDPLFLIKKREIAATKSIIANSARIQQIAEQTNTHRARESSRSDSTRYTQGSHRSQSSRSSGATQNTPMYKAGWETPRIGHDDSSDYSSHSRRHFNSSRRDSRRRDRSRSQSSNRSSRWTQKSSNSEGDTEEKLKRMMENARWRESKRNKDIETQKKEEELDKKLENQLLRMNPSVNSIVNSDIKMGGWSSKRYLK